MIRGSLKADYLEFTLRRGSESRGGIFEILLEAWHLPLDNYPVLRVECTSHDYIYLPQATWTLGILIMYLRRKKTPNPLISTHDISGMINK